LIAADTSSLVAYLSQAKGADIDQIEAAIGTETLRLPPMVVAELLSSPKANTKLGPILSTLPSIEVIDGFWKRAGESRRLLLGKGLKAGVADSLIAQSCIDAGIPLIARDRDYRHFARWCGLKLV
jgi:predicted nucleic acid-binding protein